MFIIKRKKEILHILRVSYKNHVVIGIDENKTTVAVTEKGYYNIHMRIA